jgi:hypothetical protein
LLAERIFVGALWPARATVAPYPKSAVMKCLLEFLNDEVS